MYIAYVKPNRKQIGCVCTSTEYIADGDFVAVGASDDYWVGEVMKATYVSDKGEELKVLECDGELPKIIGRGQFYVRNNNA